MATSSNLGLLNDLLHGVTGIVSMNDARWHSVVFHVCLFLFCLHVALSKRSEPIFLVSVFTFGGSTLAAFILGMRPFVMNNKYALPAHALSLLLVRVLPQDLFETPVTHWVIRIGTEMCRCTIATTWFGHTVKVMGSSHTLEAVAIGTMAGSFGAILGSASLKAIYSTPTIAALSLAVMAYSVHRAERTSEDENMAKTLFVFWMVTAQYLLPGVRRQLVASAGRFSREKKD